MTFLHLTQFQRSKAMVLHAQCLRETRTLDFLRRIVSWQWLLLLSCIMLMTAIYGFFAGNPIPMALTSVLHYAGDSHLGFVWGGGIPFQWLSLLSCLMLMTAISGFFGGHPIPIFNTSSSYFCLALCWWQPFRASLRGASHSNDSYFFLALCWWQPFRVSLGVHLIRLTLTSVLPFAGNSHLKFLCGEGISFQWLLLLSCLMLMTAI